jgi:hypothetical protein
VRDYSLDASLTFNVRNGTIDLRTGEPLDTGPGE